MGTGTVVTRTGMEGPGAGAGAEAPRDMMGTVHLCEASIRQ